MKLTVDKEQVQNCEKGSKIQWLLANGIGGFASSTAIGVNTSKYHGLLFASTHPPRGRKLILSKLEEEIKPDFSLSTNKYPGVLFPEGYKNLESFGLSPLPTYTYRKGKIKVVKKIGLVRGKNTVFVVYDVENGGEPAKMEIRPLVNCRGLYENLHIEHSFEFNEKLLKDGVTLKAEYEGSPFIHIRSDKAKFEPNSEKVWYKNMEYDSDMERGDDWHEDHYNPGNFSIELGKGKTSFTIIASTEGENDDFYDVEKSAVRRIEEIRQHGHDNFEKTLRMAADTFIVDRGWNKTIMAGYPWFDDWGRDSMISLSGLCFATGRFDEGKQVLSSFAEAEKDGVIPNSFDEEGSPHYNSVDSSLWFINAVHDLHAQGEDVKNFWPLVEKVISAYLAGNTQVSVEQGLVKCKPGLTWMDAFIGEKPVTPRGGTPVEVQALWYNALKIAEKFSDELGGDSKRYRELSEQAKEGVIELWNGKYLDDCLGDSTLRPNQIMALSLPFTAVDKEMAKSVLQIVDEKLLTPFGIRTLEPGHPDYRGKCEGSQKERDLAYHNGTVWPWLIGPYITAKVRFEGETPKQVKDILINFEQNLKEGCLWNISEIFDGDAPFEPRGCIAQAWSVGEILRCYKEDVLRQKKKHRH